MGKYGNAALRATKLVQAGTFSSPREAWETAVHKEFPGRHAAQEKGCPRGSYLGICEEGLIVGVDPGMTINALATYFDVGWRVMAGMIDVMPHRKIGRHYRLPVSEMPPKYLAARGLIRDVP